MCIVCADVGISIFLRVLGPILVVVANCLIGLVVYMYIWILLPRYLVHELGRPAAYGFVSFGLVLLFNILFNYWSCVLTKPGCPKHHLPEIDLEEGEEDPHGFGKFCRKCQAPKPPRTHHCSVCRQCVMKMDHHCPWVNNCVGFYNYRFFCLFLLYLAAGCFFTAVSCAIPLFHDEDMRRDQLIVFVFVLVLSVLFALTLFIVWHAYLVITNQTTIEFYSNRFDAADAKQRGEVWINPYTVGWRENFSQVFGPSRRFGAWLLPSWKPPPGNGMDFPQNESGALHQI